MASPLENAKKQLAAAKKKVTELIVGKKTLGEIREAEQQVDRLQRLVDRLNADPRNN